MFMKLDSLVHRDQCTTFTLTWQTAVTFMNAPMVMLITNFAELVCISILQLKYAIFRQMLIAQFLEIPSVSIKG